MTKSTDEMPERAFTWRRVLILVGLFFLYIPGWVAGVYLILKWMGRIRGMSRQNEIAIGWAGVSYVVAVLAIASASVVRLGPYASARVQADAGAAEGPFWLVLALVPALCTFLLVRTYGPPRITKNADWKGFWIGAIVAIFGIAVSISSYGQAALGGGRYLVLWGAVLWGGWKALRSLSADHPASPDGRARLAG